MDDTYSQLIAYVDENLLKFIQENGKYNEIEIIFNDPKVIDAAQKAYSLIMSRFSKESFSGANMMTNATAFQDHYKITEGTNEIAKVFAEVCYANGLINTEQFSECINNYGNKKK